MLDMLVTSMAGSIIQGQGQQNICQELWVVLEQISVILVKVVSSPWVKSAVNSSSFEGRKSKYYMLAQTEKKRRKSPQMLKTFC